MGTVHLLVNRIIILLRTRAHKSVTGSLTLHLTFDGETNVVKHYLKLKSKWVPVSRRTRNKIVISFFVMLLVTVLVAVTH